MAGFNGRALALARVPKESGLLFVGQGGMKCLVRHKRCEEEGREKKLISRFILQTSRVISTAN